MSKIGGHTINKGYFSGRYVLRVWDIHGDTIHSSVHDLPEHARTELASFREQLRKARAAETALADLPTVTLEEGLRMRSGQATPDKPETDR